MAASRAIFQSAPAVVLLAEDAGDGLDRAAKAAADLGVPLLLTPVPVPTVTPGPTPAVFPPDPGTLEEVNRLGARTIFTVGEGASNWAATISTQASVTPLVDSADGAVLPGVRPPPPLVSLLVLAQTGQAAAAAVATGRAGGARVLLTDSADPRTSSATIKAVAGQPIDHVRR